MLHPIKLLAERVLGLRSCFAGLGALRPRVPKSCGTSTSAAFEPRATATTTTYSAGFFNDTTFRAYEPDDRCHGFWCLFMSINQKHIE